MLYRIKSKLFSMIFKVFYNIALTLPFLDISPTSLSHLHTPYMNVMLQMPWAACPFLSICVKFSSGKFILPNCLANSQPLFETYLHILFSGYTLFIPILWQHSAM